MSKWRSKLLACLLLVVALGVVTGCEGKKVLEDVPPQPETVIRIGMKSGQESAVYQGMVKFKETVEEKSSGKIEIKLYSDNALGTEEELIEGLKIGNVEMACVTTGALGSMIQEYKVFTLPYLFSSKGKAHQILEGNTGSSYLEKVEPFGMKGVTFIEGEYLQLVNQVRPITSLGDLRGLKMAVDLLPYHQRTLSAFGTTAVVRDSIGRKEELALGNIDGASAALSDIATIKTKNANMYITKTNHIYQPMVLLIGDKAWGRLSAEDQAIIEEAAVVAAQYTKEISAGIDEAQEIRLKERGYQIATLPLIEQQSLVGIGQGLIVQSKNEISAAVVNGILYALNPALINTTVGNGQ